MKLNMDVLVFLMFERISCVMAGSDFILNIYLHLSQKFFGFSSLWNFFFWLHLVVPVILATLKAKVGGLPFRGQSGQFEIQYIKRFEKCSFLKFPRRPNICDNMWKSLIKCLAQSKLMIDLVTCISELLSCLLGTGK
jgi:hypothetical protein